MLNLVKVVVFALKLMYVTTGVGYVNFMHNISQTTPLITASFYGRVEVVKLLLDKGANVTYEDSETDKGTTNFSCNCLVFAILYGHRCVGCTDTDTQTHVHTNTHVSWTHHYPFLCPHSFAEPLNNSCHGYSPYLMKILGEICLLVKVLFSYIYQWTFNVLSIGSPQKN